MMGGSFEDVSGAAHALERWIAHPEVNIALPRILIEQLILAVSARQEVGLAFLLWCTNRLLRVGKLMPADKAALADALADLHVETQYDGVVSHSLQISLSVTRAECVRLANQLAAAGIKNDGISACLIPTNPTRFQRCVLRWNPASPMHFRAAAGWPVGVLCRPTRRGQENI
jgi:hypothetical protein